MFADSRIYFYFDSLWRSHFNSTELHSLDFVVEPSNKGTMLVTEEYFAFIHTTEYRSGFSSITLSETKLQTTMMGILFRMFSPLYETFNDRVYQMIANGVLPFLHRVQTKIDLQKDRERIREMKIGPQVLTTEHLKIGFIVSFIPLVFAILAFFVEQCIPSRFLMKPLIGVSVVRAFLERNYL